MRLSANPNDPGYHPVYALGVRVTFNGEDVAGKYYVQTADEELGLIVVWTSNTCEETQTLYGAVSIDVSEAQERLKPASARQPAVAEGAKSRKFRTFVDSLEKLCRWHQVQISPTMYDGLQVWNLDPDDRRGPIHFPDIEDRTTA